MDLLDALAKVYAVQAAIAITSPVAVGIKKVWPYRPPASKVITDTPCFTNNWTAAEASYVPGGWVRGNFDVNMQLLVHDADSDKAAAIASAFYPKVIEAFGANLKLGLGDWTVLSIEGNNPTLTAFVDEDGGGRTFIGLDLVLHLHGKKTVTLAAGSPP